MSSPTRFRKKPVVIEAEQFFIDREPWPRGVTRATLQHNLPRDRDYWPAGAPVVETIHGQTTLVHDGDWIIPEPDGEHFYPCKPDIFAATYEPATIPCPQCGGKGYLGCDDPQHGDSTWDHDCNDGRVCDVCQGRKTVGLPAASQPVGSAGDHTGLDV